MKKQILTYCMIAYSITWLIAFSIYISFKNGYLSEYQLHIYHALAAIGPTLAALICTSIFYGKSGLKKLRSKFKIVFPNRKVLLFILSPLILFLISLFLYRIVKNDWYDFVLFKKQNWASLKLFTAWFLPLLTYAIFEEVGWRGFLLPHLQQQFTAWTSTIYLAIIWAFWHLPFFFYRFDFSLFISIGFLFGIFVGSIILTSIYNSSKGILGTVILFHFLNNLFSMFGKEFIAPVLSTGFVFIAIYIYNRLGKLNLSTLERVKNYLA